MKNKKLFNFSDEKSIESCSYFPTKLRHKIKLMNISNFSHHPLRREEICFAIIALLHYILVGRISRGFQLWSILLHRLILVSSCKAVKWTSLFNTIPFQTLATLIIQLFTMKLLCEENKDEIGQHSPCNN